MNFLQKKMNLGLNRFTALESEIETSQIAQMALDHMNNNRLNDAEQE